MDKKLVSLILAIAAIGSSATLISGLFPRDFPGWEGVTQTGYGFPWAWHIELIIYPINETLEDYYWEPFLLDIVFWSLIITPLAVIVYRRKHGIPRGCGVFQVC